MTDDDFSSRRLFHTQMAAALIAATGALSQPNAAHAQSSTDTSRASPLQDPGIPAHWRGKEQIVLLLYPQLTALDTVGPQYMFASLMGAKVHLVAKTMEPVMSDTRMALMPTMTMAQCLAELPQLDILNVPGGTSGTLAAMRDPELVSFVKTMGQRSKLITSVCTGSMILAAAGLLQGYRATSHWLTRDLLSLGGATAVNERVVVDRNRITGAGVTAGLDLGLLICEQLRDRSYAQGVQLLAEYAPSPHLNAGTPELAPASVTKLLENMFTGFNQSMSATLKSRHTQG